MNLKYKATKLQKIKNIKIPEIFSRRMKTGISRVDSLFEEGILPGSAMTLTAQAGCGKTTFMLQVLNGLTKNGYNTGYLAGEESIYQLAYTANRVKATEVSVANITDIDEIKSVMKDLDMIVIDSFQSISSSKKLNSRALEKAAVQEITKMAKECECTVVFIMHLTKTGDLKGGTIVPHTVDANLKITKLPDTDNEGARAIFFEKNRFGPLNELECSIERDGYDFDATIVPVEEKKIPKKSSKSDKRKADIKTILDLIASETFGVSLAVIARALDNNVNRAQFLLRELTVLGTICKDGRGQSAVWLLDS